MWLPPLSLLLLAILPVAAAAQEVTAESALEAATSALQARDYAKAERELRRALGIIEKSDGPDSAAAGQVLSAIANAIDNQGRAADAEPFYRRALANFERDPADVGEAIPVTMAGLANNLNAQGRFAEAEPLFRALVAYEQGRAGANSPQAVLATNNLGYTLGRLGREREAEPLLRKALAAAEAQGGGDTQLVARVLNELAGAVEGQGRLIEAETLYRRALLIKRAQKQADVETAVATINLGSVLARQSRYDEAEPLLKSALALAESGVGKESRQAAAARGALGNLAFARLDYQAAAESYAAALSIERRLLGPDHPDTVGRGAQLADALRAQRKFGEAEPLLRQALEVRRKALGERHVATNAIRSRLGHLLVDSGRPGAAIPIYRNVVELAAPVLGRRHPNLAIAYSNLADAERRNVATVRQALDHARTGLEIAREARRRRQSGSATGNKADAAERALSRAVTRSGLRQDPLQPTYSIFLDSAWAASSARLGSGPALEAEAFQAAQDLETSAAGQAMAQTFARAAAGDGPVGELVERQQRLTQEARELDSRLLQALGTGEADPAPLRARLDAISSELARTDAELRRRFPDYAELIAPGAARMEEVRKKLKPGEGLLLIAASGYDVYAFAVSPQASRWTKVENYAETLVRLVSALRCQVDPVTCGAAESDGRYDLAVAHQLYRDLIAPVEPGLGGAKRLYATVSGPLADLPLEMLVTSPPDSSKDMSDPGTLAASAWLGERYGIIVLPSVALLGAASSRAAASGAPPFVGFGAPALLGSTDGALGALTMSSFYRSVDERGVALADPNLLRTLEPLPGTEVELGAMAKLLGAGPAALRTGAAATEGAIRRDPELRAARVLAFATHGALPSELDGVQQPGLVLTPPQVPTAQDDGFLSASEASQLELAANWVILSACNTASAEGNGGADSLSALARAFLFAGAGGLLASHWRIDDKATAALTVETLRAWTAGKDRADALQAAARVVRTGRRPDGSTLPEWQAQWAHPTYWAPFSVIAASN
jgi:CHAT domain-containing protein/tetratricopeptide (TPR) repeat protein